MSNEDQLNFEMNFLPKQRLESKTFHSKQRPSQVSLSGNILTTQSVQEPDHYDGISSDEPQENASEIIENISYMIKVARRESQK